MKLISNVSLAPLTTIGVGGEAQFFVAAETLDEVREALAFARERALPVFILGGGSNIVIADGGFNGLVIAMKMRNISEETHSDRKLLTVDAGVLWDDFVVRTMERGLFGLECLSGVPGTVGGAVVANVGAYGAQVSDTFVQAEVIDTQDASGAVRIIKKEECDFSYHDSMFGRSGGRYAVIRAMFELSTDPAAIPSYRDNRFDMASLAAELGREPTQADVREAVLKMREEKGSLIMIGRVSFKSAGSFFHMPFVSEKEYAKVAQIARDIDAKKEESLRPWAWKQPNGLYKIAPGFLLEYTKFRKGYVQGGAGISPRHTLSIINCGNACARDIANLARDMSDAVEKLFGIHLEREVEYIGDVE